MRTLLAIFMIFQLSAAITSADEAAPDGWKFYSIRSEIAPKSGVVFDKSSSYRLQLSGNGNESVDGRWFKRLPVTAGKHVVFTAHYKYANVDTTLRSIVSSILWFDEKGKQVERAEFPMTIPETDGAARMTATYEVPPKATQAEIQLRLRWSANGEVQFRDIELKETPPPSPRKVKIASINHRPRNTKSPQANLEQFAKLIDEAGAQKADIICLPEGITVCGTRLSYADVSEPIPGPATEFLGQCAARNKSWIVAGLYERDGKTIYNTSVLLSREGKLAGKYRKVCLPREEIDAGITPGRDYPVFDTDFGRIGMMICWDISYPEVARELSARGAEIIFMPIWGGNETLAKARAIENQIYLVASGYDFRTAIYDKSGEPIAKSPDSTHIIYADIDLNQRLLWPWLGDWRSRIWLEGPARAEVNR
jgi:predicted amidohydrolase